MTVTHDLKTLPVYFDAVERGEKTFEIRRDDRGFQKGDTVRLLRLPEKGERIVAHLDDPTMGLPNITRRILWILTGGQFGLEPGYVILALGPVEEAKRGSRAALRSTPTDQVAAAAERILRASARPLRRGPLARAIMDDGIEINAADPAKNVGTILWRHPERFEHVPGEGYRVKAGATPLPSGGEA